MSTFTVQAAELSSAGGRVGPVASQLGSVSVPVPDPQMYGRLVGSAAVDCEPFTTTQVNALLKAEGGSLVGSIARRLIASATSYEACETENVGLANSFSGGAS
ncbi:MAG: hypothetical protein L0G99_12050 [Propionibacteriales bacterium]|nr:hypothetical protein [Propionibacteriales bacterium]